MKVLLTGSEGFVGRHLKGYLDEYIGYDIVNGDDIRDKFKLDRLFESECFDAIINLAARAGVRRGEDFPEEYFSTNVLGLKNLIEVAEKYKVSKFIHFSSSSVFGNQKEGVPTKEKNEKKPRGTYGISKLAGELLLENSKLPYTILRPFTIIGERGRKEMVIYKWINQIKKGEPVTFYGDGTTYRGYTMIEDIIEGVQECLTNKKAEKEDFNLGGDVKITLNELWDIFKSVFPEAKKKMLPMPSVDQPHSLASTQKAKELLGWVHKGNAKKRIKEILIKEKQDLYTFSL